MRLELDTNPFLRPHDADIRATLSALFGLYLSSLVAAFEYHSLMLDLLRMLAMILISRAEGRVCLLAISMVNYLKIQLGEEQCHETCIVCAHSFKRTHTWGLISDGMIIFSVHRYSGRSIRHGSIHSNSEGKGYLLGSFRACSVY